MTPALMPLESSLLGPLAPHHFIEVVIGGVFLLLIFVVMWKVVVPAFEKMYQERSDKIEGGMRRASEAEARAEASLAEYTRKLSEAREEAAQIREDAKNTGARLVAEAREAAGKEQERILAAGRAQLAVEREQLVREVRRDVGGLATTLAGKIVGESLADDERANRTVDRFLTELETAGTA